MIETIPTNLQRITFNVAPVVKESLETLIIEHRELPIAPLPFIQAYNRALGSVPQGRPVVQKI